MMVDDSDTSMAKGMLDEAFLLAARRENQQPQHRHEEDDAILAGYVEINCERAGL